MVSLTIFSCASTVVDVTCIAPKLRINNNNDKKKIYDLVWGTLTVISKWLVRQTTLDRIHFW